MFFKRYLLLTCLLSASLFSKGQKVTEPKINNPAWEKPYAPFQLAGNLYYVGTAELAAYLVVTNQGNILINTGTKSSGPIIKANIAALGFKLSDVKILLNTQAHYDHMGAMAEIKKASGAKLMIDEADAGVVADGGQSDYLMGGGDCTFEPVKVDRVLHNGDVIKLGGMKLVMLHHPGHTKGSCSFLLDVKDAKRTYKVLIANIPTIIIDQPFAEQKTYPGMAKDYAYTIKAMKGLQFDLWVASHASQFDLQQKHPEGSGYNPEAFMDRKGYEEDLKEVEKEYEEKVK
ncbi:subclass B3 metallo-beta-lactamase [Chitinophaga sancti]|uniref:Metallo-beta-lactamase class B n=2 Tax=Chitinophaga sancti TaxID=1004 RepID=A0A1K1SBX0_9BACT|nr:subclass B3 metallo-beta-lactamase [Chitinophaga sancti]WQD63559.1 subclass B3 metallo-beta-lactamase [Chitinophaga sancti]WQG90815.1 subclass B3 metallo-beta-lactamase [Chitinophaga sancti]SFW81722.1 metallo-beta-lactamase class B [Chitinophaga sancti]